MCKVKIPFFQNISSLKSNSYCRIAVMYFQYGFSYMKWIYSASYIEAHGTCFTTWTRRAVRYGKKCTLYNFRTVECVDKGEIMPRDGLLWFDWWTGSSSHQISALYKEKESYTVKKVRDFPGPMSLTKLSLAGNNLGNSSTFFTV